MISSYILDSEFSIQKGKKNVKQISLNYML